ncbi:hypothetical protein PYCCODRAFT_1473378 [Trametes coccinea BRFM310]|uniref:Uncharacterized protein n=1 Tax=Trametes coccinea (strain BRFM310) TaxID=1353009 RepID=A0A1Y2J2P2_TRAC3|nr:hypothetical protein PYCCODRAFT_1473378 [Trametes coccinea BRFM310]
MIAEDMMEVCSEPMSSQPYGLAEWKAHHAPAPRDMPVVAWDCSASKAPLHQYRQTLEQAINAQSSGFSDSRDENTPPEQPQPAPSDVPARRREGGAKHPAYSRRHVIGSDATQDPDANEAMAEFTSRAAKTVYTSIKNSKLKAARLAGARSGTALSSTVQRRHSSEDIAAQPALKVMLKSRLSAPKVSAPPRERQRGRTDAMDEDRPVAGPSKRLFSLPPVPGFFDEEQKNEDDGPPSCTPTPPPKQRSSGRSASSASSSSSKGKSRQFSAFSESPSSLHETPLTRRHSIDPSVSCTSSHFDMGSPAERHSSSQQSRREVELSPVIPSPVALAARSVPPLPDTLPPPDYSSSQVAPRPRQSQAPHIRRSQAPSSSRLPPNMTQSPALSKPYVVPSPSQSASQALAHAPNRPPRASQRGPPALGMRRTHVGPGVGKYQVPKEPAKTTNGFKVPFKKPPGSGAGDASGAGSAVDAYGSGRGGSPVVPDPPHIAAQAKAPATSGAGHQIVEMSARRPEPEDAMDEVKEADSSYGDISWDFDPAAIDEAMSMYDD